MPSWFPSYTSCSSPSGWYKEPVLQSILIAALGLVAGAAALLAGVSPAIAIASAGLCLAGINFCSWWLNVRLICLGGNRSAIGAIYHLEPSVTSETGEPWEFGAYDTDYSFNLLLWPFVPSDALPNSFTSYQWSSSAIPTLISNWPTLFPSIPFAEVSSQVDLILAQQSMASLGLSFTGQQLDTPGDTQERFLMHCEIEGPGMRDLRDLFWALFFVFIAAAAVYAIPIIGPIISVILAILAWLAALFGGAASQNDDASPPSGGGWGGQFNPYDGAGSPSGLVDLAYCYGRWSYDSLHSGWNELHPLYYMLKIGSATQGNLSNGDWPPNLGTKQQRYDAQYATINSPTTAQTQAQPENQWTLHPLLDGCQGATPYPVPPPP
jgi:hypothetical protein